MSINEENPNYEATELSVEAPEVNPFEQYIPNNSFRGASRYIDSQVNRFESDPVTSLVYRAGEIYNRYSTFPSPNSSSQEKVNIGFDIFHKILGSDNIQKNNDSDYKIQNASVLNLNSEPNFVRRFLHNSVGVDSDSLSTTNPQIIPGITSAQTSLSKNLNIDLHNPSVVSELKTLMFGGKFGYTLQGFSTRFVTSPSDTSPSPVILGSAFRALEDSLKHRSDKDIVSAVIGFQSRPDASFYQRLFVGPTLGGDKVSVNATFFQFQNSELMQALMRSGVSFDIVTQALDRQTFEDKDNSTRVRILAGNEMILNATQSFAADTDLGIKQSKGVLYHHSFHPKVGYVTITNDVGEKKYEIAFLGTQNITAATSRHSTIESMLFVKDREDESTESRLFIELKRLQLYISGAESSEEGYTDLHGKNFGTWLSQETSRINNLKKPEERIKEQKALYDTATKNLKDTVKGKYLFFNNDIFGSFDDKGNYTEGAYVKLLREVRSSKEDLKAVVSFDYINDMSYDGKTRHAFGVELLNLAEKGKLQVVISAGEYQKAMNGLSTSVDKFLLTKLAEFGALNLSVTGKHHDKSIAVYNSSGLLKALAIGSANPTKTSAGIAIKDFKTGKMKDTGGNIEVAAVISAINNNEDQAYLEQLQSTQIDSHYFGLTGGGIPTLASFGFQKRDNIAKPLSKAYKTESPALLLVKEQERVHNIIRLKNALNFYTQTGSDPNSKYGSIVATLRYEPQLRAKFNYNQKVDDWGKEDTTPYNTLKGMSYYDAPIGLRITVTGPDKMHSLSFDATVTEEGNILIPDLNKIINGAIWANKTNVPITLFSKAPSWETDFIASRTINPGDPATKLTPFETLLAFAETVQRSFIYQEEFGLVDIMFRDSVQQDKNKVVSKIKHLFEDAFAQALPEQFSFSSDNTQILNLKTILGSLRQKLDLNNSESESVYLGILNQVAEYMASQNLGQSIINRGSIDADARKKLILESLMETLKIDPSRPNSLLKLDDLVAEKFLRSLLRTNTTYFNDYRKELIYKNEQSRAKYKSAALTQARTLLDELLSSFLAVHEETYAYYQGQERLGIFGETTTFHGYGEDSIINAQYQAGLLNPLAISHSSQVAAPGVLYRSLAATAHGNTLMLPGFGGLKQLTITDSDLSSGAAVGQEFITGMGKSSPGFAVLERDSVQDTLQSMLKSLKKSGEDLDITKELEESLAVINFTFGTSTKLIYTPFEKLEQLTQRIKNIVGFRPALEFSQDFALSLINLFGNTQDTDSIREYFNLLGKNVEDGVNILSFANYLDSYDPNKLNNNSLLEGQLRFALPEKQYLALQESIELLKQSRGGNTNLYYEDVQDYYRRLLLKQGNVQHGFIGGAKYKRMALNLGTSFMGDFSYLNPAYQYTPIANPDAKNLRTPIYGKIHNLRIKFNPERVDNVPTVISELVKLFGEGGAVAITQTIGEYRPGLYKIDKDGNISGIRIGTFTDSGLIKLDMKRVSLKHKGNYGTRREPFLIKVPAWARRTEGGMTYIAPSPHLVDTARTTNIIELDTYTIFRPGTSSRIAGGGLKKGPVVYIQSKFFEDLQTKLITNNPLLPNEYKEDRLYGMGSMGTFKGVNVETGLVLLQDSAFRKQLTTDSKNLLLTLGMLFSGDSEIKTKLVQYLYNEGDTISATSLLTTKGVDISKGTIPLDGKVDKDVNKNTLAYTSSGLLMLAGKEAIVKQDFSSLKTLLLRALDNDAKALETLNKNLSSLIDLSLTEHSTSLLSSTNNTYHIFNDSNPITRGLAILSHLFYYSSQIFSNTNNKFHSGIYELSLNNHKLYTGETAELHGYRTEDYRNFVHQTLKVMGFQPRNIEGQEENSEDMQYNLELMRLAHTRLNNQFVIETLIDNQVSQSLVASGMRDVVKQEYQFYIGMMNKKINQYRSTVGEQGVSIQKAYLEAIAVSEGDLNAMVRQQSLSFRLAIGQMDYFNTNDSLFNQPGSLLRYQDIKLRDLALMYSPSVATAGTNFKAPDNESSFGEIFNAATLNVITSSQYDQIESSLIYTTHTLNLNTENIGEVTSAGYSKGLIAMAKLLRDELTKSYRQGGLGAEQYQKALTKSLDVLTKSQRIILPYIEFEQTEDGRFIGSMRPVKDHSPTAGILLGADFVTRIGQSYGDFETEIMQSQVMLVETLNRAQPVLEKFMAAYHGGSSQIALFSDHERRLIEDLRSALDLSAKTLIEIPVTDISRQYAGDHESMAGAVGIATNSFILRPDEILLGKRYLRIAGTQEVGAKFQEKNSLLGTTVKALLNQSEFDEKSFKHILSTFAADESTLNITDFSVYKKLFNLEGGSQQYLSIINNALEKTFTGDISTENQNTLKKILVSAKLYTDLFGMKDINPDEAGLGISSNILKAVITDASVIGNITDINDVLSSYGQNYQNTYTLEKLAYLSAGFTFSRTGQPGGSSGLDSDLNEFIAIHLDKYLSRVKGFSGSIKIDSSRLETGVIVPSISRLISGLGDYDGDSYRLTMKQIPATDKITTEDENTILKKYELNAVKNKIREQQELIKQKKSEFYYADSKISWDLQANVDYLTPDKNPIPIPDSFFYTDYTYSSADESYDYAESIIESLIKLSAPDLNVDTSQFTKEDYFNTYTQFKKAYNLLRGKDTPDTTDITIGDQTITLSSDSFKPNSKIDFLGLDVSLATIFNKTPFYSKAKDDKSINLFFSSLVSPAHNLAIFNELLSSESPFLTYLQENNIDTNALYLLSPYKKEELLKGFYNSRGKKGLPKGSKGLAFDILSKVQENQDYLRFATEREIIAKTVNLADLSIIRQYNNKLSKISDLQLVGMQLSLKEHVTDDNKDVVKGILETTKSLTNYFSKYEPTEKGQLTTNNYHAAFFTNLNTDTKSFISKSKLDERKLNNLTKNLTDLKDLIDGNIYSTLNTFLTSDNSQLGYKSFRDLIESIQNQTNQIDSITEIKSYTNLLYIVDSLNKSLETADGLNIRDTKGTINKELLAIGFTLLNKLHELPSVKGVRDSFGDDITNLKKSLINKFHKDKETGQQIIALGNQLKGIRKEEKQIKEELNALGLTTLLGSLTSDEVVTRKREARQLKDLERFIKAYTNLPAYMFADVGGQKRFNTGELISLISQKYDFGNIEDASPFNKYSLLQTLIIKGLEDTDVSFINNDILNKSVSLDSYNTDSALSRKSIFQNVLNIKEDSITIEAMLNRMGVKTRVERDGEKTNEITDIAKIALKAIKGLKGDDFYSTYTNVQRATQQSQGISVIDKKLLGRHLNVLLTPEEFTTATSVIGLAGTDLIGRAYNTLIPLLDTLVVEQSFMFSQISTSMQTALSNDRYTNLRKALGVSLSGDDDNVQKETRRNRIKIRERFAGTLSVLSNFQQIVRDAIKAKEGGSILEKFHEYSNYGEEVNSLINILTSTLEDGESSHKSEKDMRKAMGLFLKGSMGPDLDGGNIISTTQQDRLFNLLPNTEKDMFKHILDVSEAVTGFGALYYLDDYTRTADNENFYEKFIANSIFGDQSQYFEEWARSHLGSDYAENTNWAAADHQHVVKHFVGKQIINLMQRAQVSFSLSSIKDDNVKLAKDRLHSIVTKFEEVIKSDDNYKDRTIAYKLDDGSLIYRLDEKTFSDDELKKILGLAGISSEDISSDGLLDADYAEKSNEDIVKQFRYQYEFFKIYEELSKDKSAKDDRLSRQLMSAIMLRQMQDRDANYQVLTPETIEYLRMSALDLSTLTSEDLNNIDPANKLKLASRYAYTTMLRGLRSGKITDTATALEASQFKLGSVLTILQENNITLNDLFGESDDVKDLKANLDTLFDNYNKYGVEYVTEEKAITDEVAAGKDKVKLASIVAGLVKTTGLDEVSSAELLRFMIETHHINKEGNAVSAEAIDTRKVTGFQLIAEQSAGLATIEKLAQASQRAYEVGDYTLGQALDARLRQYKLGVDSDNNTFNNPITLEMNDYDLDLSLVHQAEQNVQNIIAETQGDIIKHEELSNKRRMGIMQSAPIAGILAGPLLFALASSDLKADERVGMFAYDALQGAAELSARPNTTYSQYVGTQATGVHGFRMARVKQSMNTYGAVYGSLLGLSSELLYRGIGEISDKVIGATLGRRVALTPNLGTVGAAAAAEVLAAVLSQGATRAISARVMKQAKRDYEAQQDYRAIRQQLSQQLMEAYNAQGESNLIVEDLEEGNEAEAIKLDNVTFDNLLDTVVNEITGWYNALYDSDEQQIFTDFEDPSDPQYYNTASDLRKADTLA